MHKKGHKKGHHSKRKLPAALATWNRELKAARDRNAASFVYSGNGMTYVKTSKVVAGKPVYKRKGGSKKK